MAIISDSVYIFYKHIKCKKTCFQAEANKIHQGKTDKAEQAGHLIFPFAFLLWKCVRCLSWLQRSYCSKLSDETDTNRMMLCRIIQMQVLLRSVQCSLVRIPGAAGLAFNPMHAYLGVSPIDHSGMKFTAHLHRTGLHINAIFVLWSTGWGTAWGHSSLQRRVGGCRGSLWLAKGPKCTRRWSPGRQVQWWILAYGLETLVAF